MNQNVFEDLGVEINTDKDSFSESRDDYSRIDSSIAGRLNAALQFIPEIILNKSLSQDVYKVRFNKGLGVLQKAADNPGMFRANVVSPVANNDIRGQALLQSISTSPQIISGVFSAMSIVTGQYYMSQINDSLSTINKQVESIQKFLQDDKRSSLEASDLFLKHIQSEYQNVLENPCLRQATLVNIQKIKIDSIASILFDRKQVNNLRDIDIKKDNIKEVSKNIIRISDLIHEYWYSLYLYIYASTLEIIVAQHFDSHYISSLKEDVHERCEQYLEDESLWLYQLERYISSAQAFGENKAIAILRTYGEHPLAFCPHIFVAQKAAKVAASFANNIDMNSKEKKGRIYMILLGIIHNETILKYWMKKGKRSICWRHFTIHPLRWLMTMEYIT